MVKEAVTAAVTSSGSNCRFSNLCAQGGAAVFSVKAMLKSFVAAQKIRKHGLKTFKVRPKVKTASMFDKTTTLFDKTAPMFIKSTPILFLFFSNIIQQRCGDSCYA
jgi:hypothetical protein